MPVAEPAERPAETSLCPECGLGPGQPQPVRAWWIRRAWVLQGVLLLLSLAWLGWVNWSTWPVLPAARPYTPNIVTSSDFPAVRYTRADVERIARGEAGPTDFLRGMIADPHDPLSAFIEITAAFLPPSGHSTSIRRVGWPVPVVSHRFDVSYDDVYTRTGAVAAPHTRPYGWVGRTHYTRDIDASGRRHIRMFMPDGLAGLALVLALAWEGGRLLRRILVRACVRGCRGLLARRLPAFACLIGLGLAAALSFPPERGDMLLPMPSMPVTHPTGIRASEVPGEDQTSQRRLAAAILEATGDAGEGVLVFGWMPRDPYSVTSGNGGRPRINVSRQTVERRLAGPRLSAKSDGHSAVLVVRRYEADRTTVTQYGMRLSALAGALLALWAVWKLPLAVRWTALALRRRRSRRRLGRGHCVHCGYDLA